MASTTMDTEPERDVQQQISNDAPAEAIFSPPSPGGSSTASLKRTADVLDNEDGESSSSSKKRQRKETTDDDSKGESMDVDSEGTNAKRLVEDIGLELSCGCCTEICYNPVLIMPCQHYFCGSCYTLWTRNAGVNCPACRAAVTSIIPSRAIQSLIEVFLRHVPSRTRSEREREQADEIYTAGDSIKVPTPRPRSPEFAPPQDNDAYHRPCPHCAANNSWNWTCPQPIIDPSVDINRASLLTNGPPRGHANCSSCDHLHAVRAPTTSRCDFCKGSFCGLVVPTRCLAKRVREQKPLSFDSLADILQSMDIYEAFSVNTVEFDHLIDYLRERGTAPKHIYYAIVDWIVKNPEGWQLLLNSGLFPEALTPHRFDDENDDVAQGDQPPPPPQALSRQDTGQEDVGTDSEDEDDPERPEESSSQNVSATSTQPITEETQSAPQPPVTDEVSQQVEAIVLDISTAGLVPSAGAEVATPIDVPSPQPIVEADQGGNLNVLPFSLEVEEVEHPEPPALVQEPSTSTDNTEQTTNGTITPAPNMANNGQETPVDANESTQQPPASESASSTATNSTGSGETGSEEEVANTPDAPQDVPRPETPQVTPHPTVQTLRMICRKCAREVLFWGAREWWIRERARAIDNSRLDVEVWKRPDCEKIGLCDQENEPSHAREFNHIPRPTGWTPPPIPAPAEPEPSSTEPTAEQASTQEGDVRSEPQNAATEPDVIVPSSETTEGNSTQPAQNIMDVDPTPSALPNGAIDPEKVLHPDVAEGSQPPISDAAQASNIPAHTLTPHTTSPNDPLALVL